MKLDSSRAVILGPRSSFEFEGKDLLESRETRAFHVLTELTQRRRIVSTCEFVVLLVLYLDIYHYLFVCVVLLPHLIHPQSAMKGWKTNLHS